MQRANLFEPPWPDETMPQLLFLCISRRWG
jgi:hypothetical protein